MWPMTRHSSIARAVSLLVYLCCTIISAAQDTLTITLTGDILLDRGVRRYIQKAGIDSLFTPEIDSIFAHSDIVVGNLECPATNLRTPAMKQFVFRANPEWLNDLHRHGITHLNLANNHSVDQRRGGLRSTYDNCLRAGIVPLGAGRTMAEASEPVLLTTHHSPLTPLSSLLSPLKYISSPPSNCRWRTSPTCPTHSVCRRRASTPSANASVACGKPTPRPISSSVHIGALNMSQHPHRGSGVTPVHSSMQGPTSLWDTIVIHCRPLKNTTASPSSTASATSSSTRRSLSIPGPPWYK